MQEIKTTSISVIIPVYNTAPYLKQCLNSILNQTFQDFEIICINDGSTDDSLNILEEYAQQDNRVHVISQLHQNAGIARNLGLEIAKGDYVIFLDSDDFFSSELLDCTYRAAENCQADIVLFGGFRYDDNKQLLIEKPDYLRREFIPNSPIFSWVDLPDHLFALSNSAPWSKLYSRKFLLKTGLQFQSLTHTNDLSFTFSSMALAKQITAIEANLIYHRINRRGRIQLTKYINPLCFLFAIDSLYNELLHRHLYGPLQTTFRHCALANIISNLKEVKDDKARLQILESLDTKFNNLPLKEIPGTDDNNEMVHRYSLQLMAAQAQYHHSLDIQFAMEHLHEHSQILINDYSIIVSVIIPVYNTAMYLDDTLASIAEQTLKEIEIICIDDGSTDNSLGILNRWAKEDDRFIVITQSNLGQGFARNVGITKARGEYIYLMDSDDILEKQALEQLVKIMDDKYLDSLYFDAKTFFDNMYLKDNFAVFDNDYIRSRSYDDVYDGPTLMRLFSEEDRYRVNVYLQLHRRSFILDNNILFPCVTHDDNAFTFAAMLYAKRVSHIQYPYIKRRIRTNSLMTQTITFNSVYGYYRDILVMLNIYYELFDSLTIENRAAAEECLYQRLPKAQREYAQLSSEETSSALGLLESLATFRALIGNAGNNLRTAQKVNRDLLSKNKSIKKLNVQIDALQEQNEFYRLEPDNIHASVSYRLGRFLTSPARWIRRILQSMG